MCFAIVEVQEPRTGLRYQLQASAQGLSNQAAGKAIRKVLNMVQEYRVSMLTSVKVERVAE